MDFLNGDPDQPIVTGRTYHEDNRSPGDLPGTKTQTQMTIRSKTCKGSGFNELRFEDATDKEHKTTGNHISLVEGKHSLEVKGDLAEKVSGALGIKVDGDIVLESSSRISLKVGGSFEVIHSGGVDINGPKINLNGGGSPGTPVQTLPPVVMVALSDNGGREGGDSNGNHNDASTESSDSDQDGLGSDVNEGKYQLRFLLKDDEQKTYSLTDYIAFLPDGNQVMGKTDKNGYTEIFCMDKPEYIYIDILLNNNQWEII